MWIDAGCFSPCCSLPIIPYQDTRRINSWECSTGATAESCLVHCSTNKQPFSLYEINLCDLWVQNNSWPKVHCECREQATNTHYLKVKCVKTYLIKYLTARTFWLSILLKTESPETLWSVLVICSPSKLFQSQIIQTSSSHFDNKPVSTTFTFILQISSSDYLGHTT